MPVFDARLRERARLHLAAFARRAHEGNGLRSAAVAVVLLGDDQRRACFLLTRRAAALRDHPGQWALPGGRIEAGESAEQAALRELREEVGLRRGRGSVLGLLDDYPTRSGFVITPVVIWAGRMPGLVPSDAEVASVHRIPLDDLEGPDRPRLFRIPESERPVIQMPMLDGWIHAPTAAVLYQLREVVVHGRATRVDQLEQPVWAWR